MRVVRLAWLVLFACLLPAWTLPAFAGTRDPEKYPLRVHIFSDHSHRNHRFHYTFGHGQGNVIEGDQIHAMEYDYDCGHHFLTSEEDEDYPAKWKKEGLRLQLLIGVIGSDTDTRTCDLNISLREYVFVRDHGHIESVSFEEYRARQQNRAALRESLNPSDANPENYPLQLAVLALAPGPMQSGMHYGTGQGNLLTAAGFNAVDFSLACPEPLRVTPQGRYLRAKWVQPNEMVVLLTGFGEGAPSATCDLHTMVHPDVYVGRAGGLKAVSQEEFARRNAPKDPSGNGGDEEAPPPPGKAKADAAAKPKPGDDEDDDEDDDDKPAPQPRRPHFQASVSKHSCRDLLLS